MAPVAIAASSAGTVPTTSGIHARCFHSSYLGAFLSSTMITLTKSTLATTPITMYQLVPPPGAWTETGGLAATACAIAAAGAQQSNKATNSAYKVFTL